MPRAARASIRALVTDVDGTLTDRQRRLDPAAVALVQRIQAQGVPVILATGNVLPIALALHRSMGLRGPIVAENGGLLYQNRDGRETVERLCDPKIALAAFRRLRAKGLPVERLFTDRWRETEVALRPTISPVRVRRALGGMRVTVEDTGYAIHLMEPGGGKVPALEKALTPLGLTLSDCLVAGDGDNDVPMLRRAAYAVTFSNGSRRAKAAADFVARSGYATGFRQAVKRSGVLAR